MADSGSISDPPAAGVYLTLRRLFLTLFLRGRSTRGLHNKASAPTSVGRKLASVLLIYAMFGVIAVMLHAQSLFMISAYLHGLTFMFLGTLVASSAGEVLFNAEEADILLHRPISPRTLLGAKVSVLIEVSLWLAGAFNLAGFIVGSTATHGSWRFLPAHAFSVSLQALFCTSCVVLVYQACLRWFGRERLDGLMTAAQMVLSVGAVLCSQILPRVFQHSEIAAQSAPLAWWFYLLPPAWFAGIDDAIAGSGARDSWVLAAFANGVTTVVAWLAFAKLGNAFGAGLQVLNESTARHVSARNRRRRWAHWADHVPLRWWLRDPRERAAFLLIAAYLVRDRDVKLRLYPGLAPFLVFPAVFMVQEATSKNVGPIDGFGVLFASAYLGVIPLMALNMLQFSQHWRAAELFRAAPLAGPAPLCNGARKAVLCVLTFPIVAVIVVSVWVIKKDVGSLLLLLPGLIALPLVAMVPHLRGKAIPLSEPIEEANSTSRGIAMFGTMLVTMALSGVAFLAKHFGWLLPMLIAEALVVAVLYALAHRMLNRTGWSASE